MITSGSFNSISKICLWAFLPMHTTKLSNISLTPLLCVQTMKGVAINVAIEFYILIDRHQNHGTVTLVGSISECRILYDRFESSLRNRVSLYWSLPPGTMPFRSI